MEEQQSATVTCCGICREEGAEFETRCRHKFHKACLVAWINKHPSCPFCRGPASKVQSLEKLYWKEAEGADGFVLEASELEETFLAIRTQQDLQHIPRLLEQGLSMKARNKDGNTPLFLACQHKDVKTMEKLIKMGADLNDRNNSDETILQFACKNGGYKIVRKLIDLGGDTGILAKDGSNLLSWACAGKSIKTVKLLLSRGLSFQNLYSGGLLYKAARNGRYALFDIFVEHGADINCKDDQFEATPLQAAINRRRLKTAKRLLELGADPNLSFEGQLDTPLQAAVRYAGPKMVKLLLEHGADANLNRERSEAPMYRAASGGRIGIIKVLAAHGADINVGRVSDGSTPLICAAHYGLTHTITALLDLGADVNRQCDFGSYPLTACLYNNRFKAACVLVSRGANVNYDVDGRGPVLEMAKRFGDKKLIKLMIAHGAKDSGKEIRALSRDMRVLWSFFGEE